MLTSEQKDKFQLAFNEIIKQAPPELQNQWSGFVGWNLIDTPFFINNVDKKLKGKPAVAFIELMDTLFVLKTESH